MFAKLDQRAADPAMRRTLRKLNVPTQVRVRYRGVQDGGELTLNLQGDNEYSGQFPDLKEKVVFTARGEDYETARYWITVVPPPMLVEIAVEEERPAYMIYRVSGDDPVRPARPEADPSPPGRCRSAATPRASRTCPPAATWSSPASPTRS